MELKVLGSGSSGNGYVLTNGKETLLIECGMPLIDAKKSNDFNIKNMVGCIVSHEHKDHTKYIKDFMSLLPVYGNKSCEELYGVKYLEPLKKVKIGNFEITPFNLPHDMTENYGYRIYHEDMGNLLFMTDFEYCEYTFKNIIHMLVECNYDASRISRENANFKHQTQGHCELETCRKFVAKNNSPELLSVILCHLSDNANSSENSKSVIQKEVSCNVGIAYKGQEFDLNKLPF